MSYEKLAKELKKNIQILSSTFEANNLQVLNVGCKPYDDDDADLSVYVELAAISGVEMNYDCTVKINLYDPEGELYMTSGTEMYQEDFSGYDTIEITCFDSGHTLVKAIKGRLFLSKGA